MVESACSSSGKKEKGKSGLELLDFHLLIQVQVQI
jgi:hypothetical protein